MNDTTNINTTLPILLLNSGKLMMQHMDERLAEAELSTAKLWALHTIATTEELATVTCLADGMNTTKSNVTAMVDRLLAEGLVTRTRNPEDRRTVVIEMTDEGKARYEAGCNIVIDVQKNMRDLFTDEEMTVLHNCLSHFLSQR